MGVPSTIPLHLLGGLWKEAGVLSLLDVTCQVRMASITLEFTKALSVKVLKQI